MRALNRLEIVGETRHAALNVLADLTPGWLREQVTAEWLLRYGTRLAEYPWPKAKRDRQALAEPMGRYGVPILTALSHDTAPGSLQAVPAVEVLRQVWGQQFYQEDGVLHGREITDCPPSSMMIATPYDVNSRYSEKCGQSWRGYKGHLTETCEDDTPHLITPVETTAATAQDVTLVEPPGAGPAGVAFH